MSKQSHLQSAEIVTITPSVATAMIDADRPVHANRAKSKDAIVNYALAMERGEWRLNGEAIKIGANGRILDGQQRLDAVILSGATIISWVIRNVEDDVFDTLDQGKKRTGADVLSIKNIPNAKHVAAGCRAYMSIVKGGLFGSAFNPTAKQIESVVEDTDVVRWASVYASSKALRFATSPLIAVLTIGANNHGDEVAQRFIDQLAEGSELPRRSPILALRDRLLDARANRLHRLTQQVAAALMIKSWNAYVQDKEIGTLKFAKDETFPILK